MKLILAVVAGIAVFLIGFIPQYRENYRLKTEYEKTQNRVVQLERQMKIENLRDLAGRILLQASQLNYGIASDLSARYFNAVAELAGDAADERLKSSLLELLKVRDAVTGALAQGSAGVMPDLQSLAQRTYDLPDAIPR